MAEVLRIAGRRPILWEPTIERIDPHTGETTPLDAAERKIRLAIYANRRHATVLAGGTIINGVPVETDTNGRINLAGAVSLAQINPAHVFDWVTDNGVIQITAEQMIGLGVAVGMWVQTLYTRLGTVLAAIEAGTITTTAGVDAGLTG